MPVHSHGGYYIEPRGGMCPTHYPPYNDIGLMYSQQFSTSRKSMSENDIPLSMKSPNIPIKSGITPGIANQNILMADLNNNPNSQIASPDLQPRPQSYSNQFIPINNISSNMAPPGLQIKSNSQKFKQPSNEDLSDHLQKQNTKSQNSK